MTIGQELTIGVGRSIMTEDWDMPEQVDMFNDYIQGLKCTGRKVAPSGYCGYDEEEWDAFQVGWNAAKKHFGVEQ